MSSIVVGGTGEEDVSAPSTAAQIRLTDSPSNSYVQSIGAPFLIAVARSNAAILCAKGAASRRHCAWEDLFCDDQRVGCRRAVQHSGKVELDYKS